jgi:hypothetical protein
MDEVVWRFYCSSESIDAIVTLPKESEGEGCCRDGSRCDTTAPVLILDSLRYVRSTEEWSDSREAAADARRICTVDREQQGSHVND